MGSAPRRFIRDRAREESSIIEGPIKWPDGRNRRTGVLINSLNEETTVADSPLKNVKVPSLLADDVWVLSGRNGSGKTRLMEAMVKRKGNEIFERGKGVSIAYLPQFWPEEVAEGSVETFFDWIHETTNRLDTSATSKNFVDAVKKIGFRSAKSEALGSAPFLRRKLSSFSGGEQRLLWFVAVSCFQKVDALFLDEPTNHMDKNLQAAVTKAIQDFPGAVVFSTHDLQLLDATAKNVGNKGATMAPKNVVLDKTDGQTSITLSDKNPADYMRSMLNTAKREARRLSGKL